MAGLEGLKPGPPFKDTAAYRMNAPENDRRQAYEVIRTAVAAWDCDHAIHFNDLTTRVALCNFKGNHVDITAIKSLATLNGVYDITLTLPPKLENGELKMEIFIARASVENNGIHPKDSIAVHKYRTEEFEKVIARVEKREMPPNWPAAAQQMKRLAHIALNQRKFIPYRQFDMSTYPIRQAYGLHFDGVDIVDYQFIRSLSAAADIIALCIDFRRREMEVRISGKDPIPWPRFTLITDPKEVPGASNRKRTSGGLDDPEDDESSSSVDASPRNRKRAAH